MGGRPLIGSSMPWAGGATSDLAECVLAPNPSAWTLDGTNTWIVGEASGSCIIIDPGPVSGGHDIAISDALERRNNRATAVVLTHSHIDHAEGAHELARYLGVPLHTWDAARLDKGAGDVRTLRDDAVLEVNGADVRVLPTPGHSSDSVCFVAGTSILTGDTVLGRGTTLVAHPDGRLADYLASLQTLAEECREHEIATLLPGHGPPLDDPDGVVEAYLKHRHERLDEISAVMKAGASTVDEIMDRVYADIPVEVRPAAIATVRAQIEFLDND